MITTNEAIMLDGSTNGIRVDYVSNGKDRYISYKDGKVRLFTNLEVAKAASKLINGVNRFNYSIVIGDKKFAFDDCQKIDGYYRVYDDDTELFIAENKTSKTSTIGYIVFENGDTERCDKKYGINRQRELLKIVRNLATNILCDNYDTYNIDKISKYQSEYVFHIRNTTSRIHVLNNSRLMDINQARKSVNNRALPFLKEMDKFTTLYVYITRDITEPIKVNSEEIANTVLDYIIEDLEKCYPDLTPKFVPVEYNGYINLVEA